MAYQIRRRVQTKCPFCEGKFEPDYKDPKRLRSYLTDKGKIVSRSRSGVCQKHQKRLALAVKRARHLALLPYVSVLQ